MAITADCLSAHGSSILPRVAKKMQAQNGYNIVQNYSDNDM